VTPFLLEYRAATKSSEAEQLSQAVLQIQNIHLIARQITHATSDWQSVKEHSTKTVDASREIAEAITAEAKAFSEFIQKANDSEKNQLRLELNKLRRGESEWMQILIRLLDQVYGLYQAGVRSGQTTLSEQLGNFQLACRDIARRVGLVPFVASPGEAFDAKLHQLPEDRPKPEDGAQIAETLATGYSFQGQLLRPALVSLRERTTSAPPANEGFSISTLNQRRERARQAPDPAVINPPDSPANTAVAPP
jgi:molecular chaperone GrpE (heat shock protein)